MTPVRRPRTVAALALALVATLGCGVVAAAGGRVPGSPTSSSSTAAAAPAGAVGQGGLGASVRAAVLAPTRVDGRVEARLDTTLPLAPLDDAALDALPDGTVASPTAPVVLRDAPDGRPVGVLPLQQYAGAPTAVPVIERRAGWLRVLLPSRPQGATGWVPADSVTTSVSRWAVVVGLGQRTMTVLFDGEPVGVWSVAVGAPETPTPAVRTFVVALVAETGAAAAAYGPWALALGTHSPVLSEFGGGPGTVAVHGWPGDPRVFGQAVSHACVRAPADAFAALRSVPLGSPVLLQP